MSKGVNAEFCLDELHKQHSHLIVSGPPYNDLKKSLMPTLIKLFDQLALNKTIKCGSPPQAYVTTRLWRWPSPNPICATVKSLAVMVMHNKIWPELRGYVENMNFPYITLYEGWTGGTQLQVPALITPVSLTLPILLPFFSLPVPEPSLSGSRPPCSPAPIYRTTCTCIVKIKQHLKRFVFSQLLFL